ncbi:hypothetical protein HX870_31390 [Pseudomonas gingeri]|uniref:hypothetical protein n=1 Tax=Pseudomonas gingeri TaxID=117681 RepID=UPI0015A0EA63|nr:hypothetical protein [Pseudomonas gingeri]NWA29430.1 hypothetical protein [Pseudomonas gingeri]NWD72120.1 hypothetical protein [Pseudomonas gingeri]
MRYLKAIGQDLGLTGRANTVLLKFYKDILCQPDQQVALAVAVDQTGDARFDFGMAGDINQDGRVSLRDQRLLKAFTDVFLQVNWFNPGGNEQRYLKIFAENYQDDDSPNVVKLEFYEDCTVSGEQTLVYRAAGYDGDNDGVFESFTNGDVDGNGIANKADKELIRGLIKSFLEFDTWSAKPRSSCRSDA